MYSKTIPFVCFVALAIALHGQATLAQLPVSGATLWLDAAQGVTLDGSNNVTNWDNQVAGADASTNFGLPSTPINPGPITVNPTAFSSGTPGVSFGAQGGSRLDSGDWFDYANGYTIFVLAQAASCCTGGGSLFIAEASPTDKMGFNIHGETMSYNTYARNNGSTMNTLAGYNEGIAPHIAASRLTATPGAPFLDLFQDGILDPPFSGPNTADDPAAYGQTVLAPMSVRIGANFATGGTYVVGDIGEIVVFDRPLDSTEMGLMQTYLDDKHLGPPPPPTNTFKWNGGGLEDWGASSNWLPVGGSSPPEPPANDANHTATFSDTITQPTNVSTMAAVTVNRIEFDNSTHSVVVSGFGSVNMASKTESPFDTPTMSVTGSHKFQTDVNFQNSTAVDVTGSSQLVFDGALNLGGNTLTKTGAGTIAINNILASGGGTLNCDEGTCGGSGTIGGSVNNNGGTISPGNSPGILTIDGNYTQGDTGTLALEIGGLVPGDDHDKLVVMGIADLDGTVAVELTGGFGPSTGDEFDVLDFTSFVNSGYSFDFSLAGVAGDWDTSQFNSDGLLCFGACNGGGLTDYDNDGTWGLGDLNLVLFNWNEDGAILPATWINSRPPGGTLVGLPELNQVLFNWGQPGSLAAVPEPGSLLLSIVGMLGVVGFSRRWSRTRELAG
jgi:hypothetical protein